MQFFDVLGYSAREFCDGTWVKWEIKPSAIDSHASKADCNRCFGNLWGPNRLNGGGKSSNIRKFSGKSLSFTYLLSSYIGKKQVNQLIIIIFPLPYIYIYCIYIYISSKCCYIHPSWTTWISHPRRSCTLGTAECHEGSGSLNRGGHD